MSTEETTQDVQEELVESPDLTPQQERHEYIVEAIKELVDLIDEDAELVPEDREDGHVANVDLKLKRVGRGLKRYLSRSDFRSNTIPVATVKKKSTPADRKKRRDEQIAKRTAKTAVGAADGEGPLNLTKEQVDGFSAEQVRAYAKTLNLTSPEGETPEDEVTTLRTAILEHHGWLEDPAEGDESLTGLIKQLAGFSAADLKEIADEVGVEYKGNDSKAVIAQAIGQQFANDLKGLKKIINGDEEGGE